MIRLLRTRSRTTFGLLGILTLGSLVAASSFGISGQTPSALAQGSGAEEHIVTINATSAAGMAAFDVTIEYDPETVTFVEMRPGAFLPEGSELLGPEDSGDGVVSFGSYSPEGVMTTGAEGTLAEAVFAAVGDAAPVMELDREGSGLYGPDGAQLGPPASMSVLGLPSEAIYLPFSELKR